MLKPGGHLLLSVGLHVRPIAWNAWFDSWRSLSSFATLEAPLFLHWLGFALGSDLLVSVHRNQSLMWKSVCGGGGKAVARLS